MTLDLTHTHLTDCIDSIEMHRQSAGERWMAEQALGEKGGPARPGWGQANLGESNTGHVYMHHRCWPVCRWDQTQQQYENPIIL